MQRGSRSALTSFAWLSAVCIAFAAPLAHGTMPLAPDPAWESTPLGHIATGGAWADLDGDGWLDMVVANGNDIQRQTVVVYRNQGDGTLPLTPSWSATDIDYHGHLDIGDINGDGWLDVAVAVYLGPAGFGEPGGAKVYFGDGAGGFSATPDWESANDFYCFSVALGDADGDGDLDLACACGDDYQNNPERQRVFYNVGGTLEARASWTSDEEGYALDVYWTDIERDGDQDLLFCGTSNPMRLYRNAQTAGGGLATSASWESADLPQYGNTTAAGDWDGDGLPEIAVADNDQLGGQGRYKVYANTGGTPATTPAWQSASGGYGSHVSWIDGDGDGDLDLAAGRWWGFARIFENTGATLTANPVWTSNTSSVIENMFWGDVDNDGLRDDGQAIASGDGVRTHFPLGTAPVRALLAVRVDDSPLDPSAYAFHASGGWVSFATPPPAGLDNVEIDYRYSRDNDLGITNWDSSVGNYLFLHQGVAAVAADERVPATLRIAPNPMRAATQIHYQAAAPRPGQLAILDLEGRLVRQLHRGQLPAGRVSWQWDRRDERGRPVASGTYFVRLTTEGGARTERLVLLH